MDRNGLHQDDLLQLVNQWCIKFGYPLQNARLLLLSTHIARERLQIDTGFLLTGFPGVPTSMTLNDLEPQNKGFSEFFCDFRLWRTIRVNFRRNYWR